MYEVAVDHLVGQQPALEQLGLKLGVVSHPPVERGIVDIRRQIVERVTELVEQRLGIAPRYENRFARSALDEIGIVRSQNRQPTIEVLVAAIGRCPGARALA